MHLTRNSVKCVITYNTEFRFKYLKISLMQDSALDTQALDQLIVRLEETPFLNLSKADDLYRSAFAAAFSGMQEGKTYGEAMGHQPY